MNDSKESIFSQIIGKPIQAISLAEAMATAKLINSIDGASALLDSIRKDKRFFKPFDNQEVQELARQCEAGQMVLEAKKAIPADLMMVGSLIAPDMYDVQKFSGNIMQGKIIMRGAKYPSREHITRNVQTLYQCVYDECKMYKDPNIKSIDLLNRIMNNTHITDDGRMIGICLHNDRLDVTWCMYHAFNKEIDEIVPIFVIPHFDGHWEGIAAIPREGCYIFSLSDDMVNNLAQDWFTGETERALKQELYQQAASRVFEHLQDANPLPEVSFGFEFAVESCIAAPYSTRIIFGHLYSHVLFRSLIGLISLIEPCYRPVVEFFREYRISPIDLPNMSKN